MSVLIGELIDPPSSTPHRTRGWCGVSRPPKILIVFKGGDQAMSMLIGELIDPPLIDPSSLRILAVWGFGRTGPGRRKRDTVLLRFTPIRSN